MRFYRHARADLKEDPETLAGFLCICRVHIKEGGKYHRVWERGKRLHCFLLKMKRESQGKVPPSLRYVRAVNLFKQMTAADLLFCITRQNNSLSTICHF